MKIIEKQSNIDLSLPKFNCDKILSDQIKNPLPNKHHVWTFIGKPASGKTSLALSLLTSRGKKKQYRNVFDNIFVIMPKSSINSLENNPFEYHPQDKLFHELNYDVLETIIEKLNEASAMGEISLVLCDDFASDLKDLSILTRWNHLAHNKRHLKCSIWLISQGFRFVPKSFRRLIDYVCLWKFNHKDEENQIKEELSPLPRHQMDDIFRFTFKQKHDFLFMDLAKQDLYRNFNKLILSDSNNAEKEGCKNI